MSHPVEHIAGKTFHARRGALENRFTYSVDYLLLEPEVAQPAPAILSRNRRNLLSVQDRDHGGARGAGRGASWVRDVLAQAEAPTPARIHLLTQPRVLGHVFNPVSFWLCLDPQDALICVIAEVNNTFGARHSYLCHHDDFAPIRSDDELTARKIFHVSPFQPTEGNYRFRFDISAEAIAIRIDYGHRAGGLIATLTGPRKPASTLGLLGAMLRRPLGSRRVLALIHWQALKLWWKGAGYRPPAPVPVSPVSPPLHEKADA
ncbi:DUF1365 domain-containing protein [Pararhodobacter oceanensis]|uniref:DUF1365 domain-containing protein n=1 Tax=Pararhodobacter oceanensis TaxID=2172121 RepID=A0A2T8HSD0_9RHOB|nr:DUF1365 domain-containing protein [Pararhodobacter oceanensis]PVH28283.1 DUF1365 domain-containing protein [Pararhodobacter oceanensis]